MKTSWRFLLYSFACLSAGGFTLVAGHEQHNAAPWYVSAAWYAAVPIWVGAALTNFMTARTYQMIEFLERGKK